MRFIKFAACCVCATFILGLASGAGAWDWKKCKKPYKKCHANCTKKHPGGWSDELNLCIDSCSTDLYQCRLKKNRFKKGKDKKGLMTELGKLDKTRDACQKNCSKKHGGDLDKLDKCVVNCEKDYMSNCLDVYENYIDTGE